MRTSLGPPPTWSASALYFGSFHDDRAAAQNRMHRARAERRDLVERPFPLAGGVGNQEVHGLPDAAAVGRPVVPQVDTDVRPERREIHERGKVELAVVPGARALELAWLTSVGLDLHVTHVDAVEQQRHRGRRLESSTRGDHGAEMPFE